MAIRLSPAKRIQCVRMRKPRVNLAYLETEKLWVLDRPQIEDCPSQVITALMQILQKIYSTPFRNLRKHGIVKGINVSLDKLKSYATTLEPLRLRNDNPGPREWIKYDITGLGRYQEHPLYEVSRKRTCVLNGSVGPASLDWVLALPKRSSEPCLEDYNARDNAPTTALDPSVRVAGLLDT
jgi:hypothetical protein